MTRCGNDNEQQTDSRLVARPHVQNDGGCDGAVARVFGVRLTGFVAWWLRRTYYLFQMPRWDRRLRIVLDWTVALFFLLDITRVPCAWERAAEAAAPVGGEVLGNSSGNAELECFESPSPSVDALAASTSTGRTAAPA
jgi:hypothetical protein